jgi:hypothetical protein
LRSSPAAVVVVVAVAVDAVVSREVEPSYLSLNNRLIAFVSVSITFPKLNKIGTHRKSS